MSTQIKRLYQSGSEFVPITLSEAVVVNATNLPDIASYGITTLDKVLRYTLSSVAANNSNYTTLNQQLENAVTDINTKLSKKQDKLTAGQGITIENDASGNLVISTNISFEIYKLVDTLPENPTVQNTNTIYLVPTTGISGTKDILEEYIAVLKNDVYIWERLGRIQPETGVDLSGYITRDEFNQTIQTIQNVLSNTITAQNVTTSEIAGNSPVIVTYDIPSTLYDSVVATNDDNSITA